MNLYLEDEKAADNFWRLSSDFYQQPEVKELLLKLQNQHQKNVNEILFALWVVAYYQLQLNQEIVAKLLEQSARTKSWIENIRETRFDLESQWQPPYPEKINQARAAMLETEINIEKLHQQKLVEILNVQSASKPCTQVENDKLINNLQILCGGLEDASFYDFIASYWIDYCRLLTD